MFDAGRTSTNSSHRWTTGSLIPQNEWTHLCTTCDDGKLSVYINGEKRGEANKTVGANNYGTITSIGMSQANGGTPDNKLVGRLNDLRVYDNVLSPAEIKKLSQGLVLHYPLDGNGLGGLNEMPNSIEMPHGSANAALGRWRNAGSSSMTKSRVYIESSPVGPCYAFQNKGIQTPNDGSCWGIDSFPREPNTDYCISAWARITEGTEGYVGFNLYGATHIDGFDMVDKNYRVTQLPADGSWKRVYCHVKTGSGTTGNIYIGTTTGDTSVTTQMCAIKLEKGSVPTDWSPAAADMPGYDETKVYDISGFRNDGVVDNLSLFSVVPSSRRYRYATNIVGGKISMEHKLFGSALSEFTASAWVRLNSGWTKNYGMYLLCFAGDSYKRLCVSKDKKFLQFISTGTTGGGIIGFGSDEDIVANRWYHTVLTYNSGTVKAYVDGELIGTGDISASATTFGIGNGTPYFCTYNSEKCDGALSDLRLYVTAIDDEAVKDLYQAGRTVRE